MLNGKTKSSYEPNYSLDNDALTQWHHYYEGLPSIFHPLYIVYKVQSLDLTVTIPYYSH
jgi:hypothetical protein